MRDYVPRWIIAIAILFLAVLVTPSAQEVPSPSETFASFLNDLRAEALTRGIRAETLDRTLSGLTLAPVVVARDRHQPEQVLSLDSYVRQRLTAATLRTAREMAARHRELLDRVEATFGVSHSLMIAIWGLESNFGRFTGSYPTIQALATLTYDNRRPLFRTELLDALTMVDRGMVAPDAMKGSWAGAMGQPQFMPSSFLKHGTDFDGDGTIDIWTSPADVFASMANFLSHSGWTRGERWGREVKVTAKVLAAINRTVPMRTAGCRATRAMTEARPLATWTELGVTLTDGRALPGASLDASLVRGARRYFLVYGNYGALLEYNCSHSYAITAGLLADAIP